MQRLFPAAKAEHYWSKWGTTPQTIDQTIYQDRERLVARSREQYAANPYIRRYVGLCQKNIVGAEGVACQSIIKDAKGNPDEWARTVIDGAWREFGEEVTACGMDMVQFQNNVVQGTAVDGEVFVLRHVERASRYGLRYSIRDSVLCPTNYNDPAQGITAGIKYDRRGAPVEYYFKQLINGKTYAAGSTEYEVIPASEVLHVFVRDWVGQKRGLPWTATALGTLKDLGGYIEAAIISARAGASKMAFLESTGDAGKFQGDGETEEGDPVVDMEPGTMGVLPKNYKMSDYNPDYPHQQFGDFVNHSVHTAAMALGVAHHSLSGDMSKVNYTQGRTALLDERDGWKGRQAWLIATLVRRVHNDFVAVGVDMGFITAMGKPLRNPSDYYTPTTYQGRRWQWVDPLKDINAIEKALKMNVSSLTNAIRDTGRSRDEVLDEIAADTAALEKRGIKADNIDNTDDEVDNEYED